MKKKYILVGMVAIGLLIAVVARANPIQFLPHSATATATSSVNYIGAGTGTTTLSYDAYAAGQPLATESATLFIQSTASSTASVLFIDIEYSQDGTDWYQDLVNISTTSVSQDLTNENRYTIRAEGTTRVSRAFNIKTPTRYVRAVISATASSSAVWADIIPVRQRTE